VSKIKSKHTSPVSARPVPEAVQDKTVLRTSIPVYILFAFAFLLYGNTLVNDYTLDDSIVIKDNSFTKKGFAGIREIFSYDSFTGFFGKQKNLVSGGRYRPLSLASFAVEYQVFGGLNPFMGHLFNILFYALTGWLVYIVFMMLIRQKKKTEWYFGIPFLAAILFMAHPVHTEVVANIKGRDELFALIFSLLSLIVTLRFLKEDKSWLLAASGFFFFLGLLSKENTIMFLLIIPLAVYFFITPDVKKMMISILPLIFSTVLFLYIRYLVLGYFNSSEIPRELLNNPFLEATSLQKYGTILYTLGIYLKLLFFPSPLTHDYYPYQIPLVGLTDLRSLIPLLIYLGLLGYALAGLGKKTLPSFGILFYLITLFIVSNILFPVGTFMNERFLYMPSLGFSLILAWFFGEKLRTVIRKDKDYQKLTGISVLIILVLFSLKTITRNPVWKDDFTLFTTDVKVSVNSTKCTTSAGGKYLEKAQVTSDPALKQKYFDESFNYLTKAVSIYPANTNGRLLLGNALAIARQDYKGAIDEYMKVISIDPYNTNAYQNAIKVLGYMNRAENADYMLQVCYRLKAVNPAGGDIDYLIGKVYGQFKGNLDSSEVYLLRAVALSPGNPAAYKDLGVLYGMKQELDKALTMLKKANELDPGDVQTKQNLDMTYKLMGKIKK